MDLIRKYLFSGDSRSIKYNTNVLIMVGTRGLSVLISLLYVPLLLHSLDRTDYGILITLTSIIGWISMLDIGLGNGLRNKLTIAIAEKDDVSAKTYVSTTYASVGIYIGIVTAIFLIVGSFLDWSKILNAAPAKETQLYYLSIIVFLSFGLNFIFGVLNSILFSFQLPYYQSLMSLMSQIISFAIVFVLVKFYHESSILVIASVTSFIPPIVLLLFSIFLFKTRFKFISPSFKFIKYSAFNSVISLGVKFFILQIITIVLFQVNTIIITHLVSAAAVVEYNIAFRYLDTIAVIFTIFVTPVWSASAEAYLKKDFDWIKKTVDRLVKIAVLISLLGLVMVLASKFVFNIWLGKDTLSINVYIVGLVLMFVSFKNLYQCYGFVINGTGKIKAQMMITFVIAVLYIPSAIFLGKIYGIYGILSVSAASQFINFVWSRYQYKQIMAGTAKGIWNS